MLGHRTPRAVDGYRQANTRVWEGFDKAMENDHRSASKKFWQAIRRLRKEKQCSANTVYSGGGKLLTSTRGIVGQWKENSEEFLNPEFS